MWKWQSYCMSTLIFSLCLWNRRWSTGIPSACTCGCTSGLPLGLSLGSCFVLDTICITVMHLEECFSLLRKLGQHGRHFMLQWKLIWQFCYIFVYIIKTDLIMVHAEVWLISRQLLHFIVRGHHGCDRMRCMLRYD